MSSSQPLSLRPFFASVILLGAGLVACSGSASGPSSPNSGSSENLSGSGAADACRGKACGVDCTPDGSDEPFNCNAQGKCVAAGADLGCAPKKCPEFLGDCTINTRPADLDGDGCIDGCEPDPAACNGKVCGVDCTPGGSDEPFNCNAKGECVASGNDLGCGGSTNVCAGKACGVDCTPEGSDEPFNCNAKGECVVTGQPLGCGK